MIFFQIYYRVAFLTTALVHLWWNDLPKSVVTIGMLCLSHPGQPILYSILRLHTLVLLCFLLGFCFSTVSAHSGQAILRGSSVDTLNFDDIQTPNGFGNLTTYRQLLFGGFYTFDPSHPTLEGIISTDDLNCAVSKPNALYGTRDNLKSPRGSMHSVRAEKRPSIRPSSSDRTLTLLSLKLKPLDMPLGFVTISLQGYRSSPQSSPLSWSVDFPAGFHNVLEVRLEEFSKQSWDGLELLEVWADFHYNGVSMDWEFCIDDMDVEIVAT